ncbi:MAG: nucleotidyltransferase domain-containing protein [Chloroflexota bacterium]|nr:nucleotidyltransferase domain-containing protein [Chloroflexota bacterium]
MRRSSWTTWQSNLKGYEHRAALGNFIHRMTEELFPLAILLFGSLAKGNYHTFSDADVCVILPTPEAHPFEGYGQMASLDPTGVIQPMVYGREQFMRMISEANGLALEVMYYGIALAGQDAFLAELEEAWQGTRERLGLEKTATGWQITKLKEAS